MRSLISILSLPAVCASLTLATARAPGVGTAHSSPPQPAPSVRMEVRFSKPLAVLHFLRQISPKARNNPLRTLYSSSRFADPSHAAIIAAFDSITLGYEYPYPQYAKGKIEGSTLYTVKRNLILATSLDDFRNRTIGVIPTSDVIRLTAVIEAFTPVYDSLVYAPNRAVFERQLHQIDSLLAARNIARSFDRVRAFYRSAWDPSVPFVFAFYPLPGGRGFSATAYGNIAESELPTSETDYSGILSVMLHEASHILLDEQPIDVNREMAGWYAASSARTSHYAKGLMQEAWATAVANGYFYEQLTGALNPRPWYNLKYIDLMARQLLPHVRPYLDGTRPLDKALVDAYVDIYEHTFPQWLTEWANLMTGRAVLSDREADFALIDGKFPYRNDQLYLHDFSDASFQRLRDAGMTKLVIVSHDNQATLELVRRHFPELAGWRPDATKDFAYSAMLGDKSILIIANVAGGALDQLFASPLPPPVP